MELDRRGAELLFQVLTEREEKNSVAIASNDSFGSWTKTFTDPRLCAALSTDFRSRQHHRDGHRLLPASPQQSQSPPRGNLSQQSPR
jgi:DNA replication protein DnaC